MEIKRLSKTELSVYLDAADLDELGITYETLDYVSPQTRLVIRQLLETALAQTGFDPEGQRLFIEAYPVEEDGCLLLFTLSNMEERAESAEPTLFLFSSFDLLRQACRQLKPEPPSALFWQEERYILALWLNVSQSAAVQKQLLPFGKAAADSELLLAELQEHHCCLIREQAVQQINRYFK